MGEGEELCVISSASLTAALGYGKAPADSAGVYRWTAILLVERLKGSW